MSCLLIFSVGKITQPLNLLCNIYMLINKEQGIYTVAAGAKHFFGGGGGGGRKQTENTGDLVQAP